MEKTIFKKIIDKEIPAKIIYEDEHTLAFLDIRPTVKGHTLVIPKEEAKDIFELSDEGAKNLLSTIKKTALAVKKATSADGINILSNNGAASGQVIFHLHFHIIPRYSSDGLRHWPSIEYKSEDEMLEMQKKIKDQLSDI